MIIPTVIHWSWEGRGGVAGGRMREQGCYYNGIRGVGQGQLVGWGRVYLRRNRIGLITEKSLYQNKY